MKGTGMKEQGFESQSRTPKPKDLEIMSIEALGEYIEGMEAEIERVRATTLAKHDWRANADKIFKN
jgi:uncharacterized small protein (DUF1192 family)